MFPTQHLSGRALLLLWSAWALKIGPWGVAYGLRLLWFSPRRFPLLWRTNKIPKKQDIYKDGVPRLRRLAALAYTLRHKDPEEGAAIDDLAQKLAGREYFLDPRVFNYPQVRHGSVFFGVVRRFFDSKPCVGFRGMKTARERSAPTRWWLAPGVPLFSATVIRT